MPVLAQLEQRFAKEQPLAGIRIAACLHVTTETANLMRVPAGGRRRRGAVRQQPALHPGRRGRRAGADYGIPVFAIKGEDNATYYRHIKAALDHKPQITMDDGADLVRHAPQGAPRPARRRHRRHRGDHHRRHPPAQPWRPTACSSSPSSPSTRPRPSTSSTTATAPARAPSTASSAPPTSCSPARTSSSPATAGAAAGIAMRAQGMGANVIVTEIDPLKALEAVMDGYRVMPMAEAAPIGDIFVTVTGDINVIDGAALRGHEGRRHRRPTPATSTSRSTSRPWSATPSPSAGSASSSTSTAIPTAAGSTCWARAAWSTWPPPRATRPR